MEGTYKFNNLYIAERLEYLERNNCPDVVKKIIEEMLESRKNLRRFKDYNYIVQKNEVSYAIIAAYSFFTSQNKNGKNPLKHNIVVEGSMFCKFVFIKMISSLLDMKLIIDKNLQMEPCKWILSFDFAKNEIEILDNSCQRESKKWFIRHTLNFNVCPYIGLEMEDSILPFLNMVKDLKEEDKRTFDNMYRNIIKITKKNNDKDLSKKLFSILCILIKLVKMTGIDANKTLDWFSQAIKSR